jgi:sugar-specific transcriptional regulator TrmB
MENLNELIQLGFTEYEAKVYLALLNDNPTTGYQLSKQAAVPRSMVYEALGRLLARGAVMKSEDQRTTLYRPVPPNMLLDRYEQENQRLINSLRTSLSTLYSAHNENHLWSIYGRSSVLTYASQMILEAEDELLLVLPDSGLDALRNEIKSASEQNASLSILLTGQGEIEYGKVIRHPPQESELQELTAMLVVVADRRTCLIGNMDLEMSATITNNPNLVYITRQFVWMELFTQRKSSI